MKHWYSTSKEPSTAVSNYVLYLRASLVSWLSEGPTRLQGLVGAGIACMCKDSNKDTLFHGSASAAVLSDKYPLFGSMAQTRPSRARTLQIVINVVLMLCKCIEMICTAKLIIPTFGWNICTLCWWSYAMGKIETGCWRMYYNTMNLRHLYLLRTCNQFCWQLIPWIHHSIPCYMCIIILYLTKYF